MLIDTPSDHEGEGATTPASARICSFLFDRCATSQAPQRERGSFDFGRKHLFHRQAA